MRVFFWTAGWGAQAVRQLVVWCFATFLVVAVSGCEGDEKRGQLQLGDRAPDFMAKDLDGRVIVLSNYRGSPVILRFFETGCRYCKADTPSFISFYKKHQDSGLQIFYIGSFYEDRKALQLFADELGVAFPVLIDGDARLADLYNIRAYPQTIFLSDEHRIAGALLGGVGTAELNEIMGKFINLGE